MNRIPSRFRHSLVRCFGLAMLALIVAASFLHWESRVLGAQEAELRRNDGLKTRLHGEADQSVWGGRGDAIRSDLMSRGVIGPERRLDWIGRLDQLREAHRIESFEYELGPQGPAASQSLHLASGRYEFLASPMTLRLNVLHEQQLLDFFDDLGKPGSAILRLRSCRMERIPEPPEDARLGAECTLDWITLREKA
jgi:hypothetical protein